MVCCLVEVRLHTVIVLGGNDKVFFLFLQLIDGKGKLSAEVTGLLEFVFLECDVLV